MGDDDRELDRSVPRAALHDHWVLPYPVPEAPARVLEDGVAAIRRAVHARRPVWATLPARLAAAAAGPDGVDEVELYEPERALRTRWERSAEGTLSVTVTAADPVEDALVAFSWEPGDDAELLTVVTPLAPAPGGAFVRYEVEQADRRRRTCDIPVRAARPVRPAEVDLDAVRRAFARRPKGVVIRAWRTYLDRVESPAQLDTVVRDLLRDYEQ